MHARLDLLQMALLLCLCSYDRYKRKACLTNFSLAVLGFAVASVSGLGGLTALGLGDTPALELCGKSTLIFGAATAVGTRCRGCDSNGVWHPLWGIAPLPGGSLSRVPIVSF